MSDFLLNLARRSAGLAPVVRARPTPLDDGNTVANVDANADVAREPLLRLAATPVEMMPRAQIAGPRHPAAAATPPAPLVAAADRAPTRTARRAVAASTNAPAVATNAVPRSGEPPTTPPSAKIQLADSPATPLSPVAMHTDSATSETHEVEPRLDVLGDPARYAASVTEVLIPSSASGDESLVMKIEPAERPITLAQVPPPLAASDRTIHVRIGAIEMVGADGPSAARASAEPPSPTAEAPRSGGASVPAGFDDFAALRSYAPWAW